MFLKREREHLADIILILLDTWESQMLSFLEIENKFIERYYENKSNSSIYNEENLKIFYEVIEEQKRDIKILNRISDSIFSKMNDGDLRKVDSLIERFFETRKEYEKKWNKNYTKVIDIEREMSRQKS